MKRFKRVFQLFFVLAILFNCKGVFAAGKTISHAGVNFNIEKIYLDVYESNLDDSNTFNGFDKSTKKEIDITNLTNINPKFRDYDDSGDDKYTVTTNTYIDLGLDITDSKILELLKTNGIVASEDKHYYVLCLVDYSITEMPSRFKFFYRNVFDGSTNEIVHSFPAQDGDTIVTVDGSLNTTYPQIFNAFEYKIFNGSEYMNYDSSFKSGNSVYYDYLLDTINLMSHENGVPVVLEDDTVIYSHAISFIGFDNVDVLIEEIYKGFSDLFENIFNNSDILDSKDDQVVPIPNTFEGASLIYVIGGAIVLLIGSVVVYKNVKPCNAK